VRAASVPARPLTDPARPGSYMLAQRKKVLGKPRPAGPDMSQGIQFPRSADGERSTSAAGQAAFAFSALAADTAAATAVFKVRLAGRAV
jgi:hypothetical protein